MNTELDSILLFFFAVAILFLAAAFLYRFVRKICALAQELEYVNHQIRRTLGEDKQYWKREKRRLWRSLLPFYRG